ncbi:putative ATPase [Tamaricihabitans halophyticus]|uniref:Putative ATPase n=1 Tax=Tamaricihabitans halophyticus TaxID=1262583 RepID=A0A4R2QU46_9PSEU|nr:ATP-binding protein [Tamaricihabitans halophyticus]TCP53480.1 putative ATPase [Tamaricihabitans halophyticus]
MDPTLPHLKRFILTGTPGAGKTAILRRLTAVGYTTVTEAATAVIRAEQSRGHAEPWTHNDFIEKVVTAQQRLRAAARATGVQVHDRSPICTHALATWLGHPVPPALSADIARMARERLYARDVFFVRNLGYCEQTEARRISYAECVEFERLHEQTYRAFGYRFIEVPAAALPDRVTRVRAVLDKHA